MLTDENDCSIVDGGIGWIAASRANGEMPPATSECDSNPNDKCCRSCGLTSDFFGENTPEPGSITYTVCDKRDNRVGE